MLLTLVLGDWIDTIKVVNIRMLLSLFIDIVNALEKTIKKNKIKRNYYICLRYELQPYICALKIFFFFFFAEPNLEQQM